MAFSRRSFAPDLLDLLEELRIHDWSELVYRQVIEGTPPLTPNVRGARWNPPAVEALYCSLSQDGAEKELNHILERQPVTITKPRKTYELEITLSSLIEIRDLALLEQVEISTNSLEADDWTDSQHIGGAINWLGDPGLIVPSVRTDALNLVVYVNNQEVSDHVAIRRQL